MQTLDVKGSQEISDFPTTFSLSVRSGFASSIIGASLDFPFFEETLKLADKIDIAENRRASFLFLVAPTSKKDRYLYTNQANDSVHKEHRLQRGYR